MTCLHASEFYLSFVTDVMSIKYFQHIIIILYLCSNVCEYIQSTHWLVPGYCLGQIFLARKGTTRCQPRNPHNGDSSLAKIGINLVSCSRGKWSPIDTDVSQPASAINH